MKAEKLELMEKWLTLSTLMGLDYDNIYDDWDNDGQDFFSMLEEYEQLMERLKEPNEIMKVVLQTVNMGVTSEDIEEYVHYRNSKEEELRQAERMARIYSTPAIVELRENRDFKILPSGRYKNHTYFSFKNAAGKEFQGRAFRQRWDNYRIWLTWKDKNGKKVSWKWDSGRNGIAVPHSFPHEWKNWGYATELNHMVYIIAHHVVNKTMPKAAAFKYPK